MGNESPEYTALQIAISLIDDELGVFSTQMTEREKRIYSAMVTLRNRLEAEAKELEQVK